MKENTHFASLWGAGCFDNGLDWLGLCGWCARARLAAKALEKCLCAEG